MEPLEHAEITAPQTGETVPERFELIYQGPDLQDGTMSARELAEVLTGVSRAFTTVACEADLGDRYQLRIRDVESNSFHIILEAIEYAKANPAPATAIIAGAAVAMQALSVTISGAYRVVTDIAKLIDAKKRARGKRIALLPTVFEDGQATITAPDDVIVLTKEQYELLLTQRVDRHLSQIVSPLEPKKIDTFQMRHSNSELVIVEARQRDYFDYVEVTEEKSKEGTSIVGTLNSLSKNNLRGTFYTADGVHVPYRYVGGDVGQLFRGFTARELLKVHGRIKYGTDGVPRFVEVQDIEVFQRGMFET
jgi:hypothetical protein